MGSLATGLSMQSTVTIPHDHARFQVLDGWRGVSILAVLACHLLPLGPKPLQINFAAGVLGMSLFFTLSGFLVTHFLLSRPQVIDFLMRRFFRILPLAWLYIVLALTLYSAGRETWLAHLFFYANYPPKPLIHVTDHFWSLCVEMHFYVGVALLVALLRQRALLLIPLIALGITLLRVFQHEHVSVITHLRVDEILAGSTLALIYNRQCLARVHALLQNISPVVWLLLLLVACHPASGFMNYLRPYFAAMLVGSTLFRTDSRLTGTLAHPWLAYLATISFALYVIHPLLAASWLGSGEVIEKYAKRPLLFLVLFFSAHLSTFYYEQRAIAWGKRLSRRWGGAKT